MNAKKKPGKSRVKVTVNGLFLLVVASLATWSTVHASGYGYHHGYSDHYNHGYHNHVHLGFHGHADGEIALGLLAGVLLGYALLNHHGHRARPDARPVTGQIYRPVPAADSSCLQEREYHTTIIIDGEAVPAWGIACLQTDGSWQRRGINLGS